MSWKVGLGDNHDDLDLQGEIDVAFFDPEVKEAIPSHQNATSCELDKPASADLPGLGQKCHTCDNPPFHVQPFQAQSSNLSGQTFEQCLRQSTDHFYTDCEMVKPHASPFLMVGGPQQITTSTNRDMKDRSPLNRNMSEDDVTATSPNSSVSVTDSDGVSSLSEDSMEGLSESESITDVTPLHSPYMCDSPVPTNKLSRSKLALPESSNVNGIGKAESSSGSDSDESAFGAKRKGSVKFAGKVRLGAGKQQKDSVDIQLLVDAIRQLEAHQCDQPSAVRTRRCDPPSMAKGRKNMSFTNEEVQKIDRENQRLLKRILAQQNRPKPKFDTRTPSRLAPSAINRQRQQRQIEVENLALLKRIESAKPSRDVGSSAQGMHSDFGGPLQRGRSHSLSLTRHRLSSPSVASATGKVPLATHFPHRQKHHSQ